VMGRVDYKILENRRTDTNDSHEFIGEQVVYETDQGEVKDPRGDRTVKPKLLGAEVVKGEADRLDALAAVEEDPDQKHGTSAAPSRESDNPLLQRAQAAVEEAERLMDAQRQI